MNKPPKRRKKTGTEGETLNQESGGREEKRYATRTPRHAKKASSTTQTDVGTWPAHAPKQHTAGQESAATLTNNG